MVRSALLSVCLVSLSLFISHSSSSFLTPLHQSLSFSRARRQANAHDCAAIHGFTCRCTSDRATCKTSQSLPQTISIDQDAKQKYSSVELVIGFYGPVNVDDQTFAPIKELFKPDARQINFRIKFENFTALHLVSPGLFNSVFSDSRDAHKTLALEISNWNVQPDDNPYLFQNLNIDHLELYGLYPFRGTFQQLFDQANIKSVRLSGGEIRPDLSTPFTGNVVRFEMAKQAKSITMADFPLYPVHEYIIDAYYLTDFSTPNAPDYANLAELRVHTHSPIPANAFRQFPNVKALLITTNQDIDPHALDGLGQLEKLTIRDTKPSKELLQSVRTLKELDVPIENLNANEQCELVESLANGQYAVQATPNGRKCTCITAYLQAATGQTPCDVEGCENSPCAALKDAYDATARTWRLPPRIERSDGSNAFEPSPPKSYSSGYIVPESDRRIFEQAVPPVSTSSNQHQPGHDDRERPSEGDHQGGAGGQTGTGGKPPKGKKTGRPTKTTTTVQPVHDQDQHPNQPYPDHSSPLEQQPTPQPSDSGNNWGPDNQQPGGNEQPEPYQPGHDPNDPRNQETTPPLTDPNHNGGGDQPDDSVNRPGNDDRLAGGEDHGDEGQRSSTAVPGEQPDQPQNNNENSPQSTPVAGTNAEHNGTMDGGSVSGAQGTTAPKKAMNWLPIIIIAASIVALLIAGLIFLFFKKKRAKSNEYRPTSTSERGVTKA